MTLLLALLGVVAATGAAGAVRCAPPRDPWTPPSADDEARSFLGCRGRGHRARHRPPGAVPRAGRPSPSLPRSPFPGTASAQTPETSTPTSAPTSASTSTPIAPARRAGSVVAAQAPRSATLPSGRTVPVSAVGTTSAGLLDVPDDIDVAGWWQGWGAAWATPSARSSSPLTSTPGRRVSARSPSSSPLPRRAHPVAVSAGLQQTYEVQSRRLVSQGDLADDVVDLRRVRRGPGSRS